MNTNMEQMSKNLDIVLQYFKPIDLTSNPVSPSASPPLDSESDYEYDGNIQTMKLYPHQLGIRPVYGNIDEPDCKLASNSAGNIANQAGIDSFIEHYGLETASNVFNSITQYPSENMMTLLHSYKQELEKTTKIHHKRILEAEIIKLQKQINLRRKYCKKHLINVVLQSPDENHMKVQKKYFLKYLTGNQLCDIVLKMKGYSDIVRQRKELKKLIWGRNTFRNDERFRSICKKLRKENTWDYVEKMLMNIEPDRSECCICFTNPKEYIIVDCGHFCLCKCCKEEIESKAGPTCPICRKEIVKIIKVYE